MMNGCGCRRMLDLMCHISDITLFLYQLAQAHPDNVLHFLVYSLGKLTMSHNIDSDENCFSVILQHDWQLCYPIRKQNSKIFYTLIDSHSCCSRKKIMQEYLKLTHPHFLSLLHTHTHTRPHAMHMHTSRRQPEKTTYHNFSEAAGKP